MLPSRVKAEVKLSTGAGVSLGARELEALAVDREREAGLVAVLFVGGERELDGRWTIVDAGELRRPTGDGISISRGSLVATARSQPGLDPVRRHVDELWPAFLQAFADDAQEGHGALLERLEAAHREGRLRDLLPRDPVLAIEHRKAVHDLVERHGESDAGRLVQDLLAYLIALAGYRNVTVNAVGVPDFVLEGCAAGGAEVAGADPFTRYRAAVQRSVTSLAAEFRESPESFLYESDLQGRLYSRLFDALAKAPLERDGEDYWRSSIGRGPLRINPVRSEYPDGIRFDVALLDLEAARECPENVWNLPVRLAIELKFSQAIGGDARVESDLEKLERYAALCRPRPFTGVSLLFSHRRGDPHASELARRYGGEALATFSPIYCGVEAWVVTP